ncbi:MAG: hypothetical protein M3480_02590 [Verrucomicrobiota bacterium]|nr:hypothetical protein [Verrucomicrobiota bacterium]
MIPTAIVAPEAIEEKLTPLRADLRHGDAAGNPYGMGGMRYNPFDGVLYGSTMSDSPTNPSLLRHRRPGDGFGHADRAARNGS